jgi:hypothetical protein
MIQSFEGRDFKFWHYNISHGELLIRSIKSSERIKNLDIMFFDVIYIELHRNLPNLIIEEPTDSDILYVKEKINKSVNIENIIILSSNDKRYLVVASIMKIVENELDMFELPFNK